MADTRPGAPAPVPRRVGPRPTRMLPTGPTSHGQRSSGQDPAGRKCRAGRHPVLRLDPGHPR
eukprot:2834865-Alexandrium_andersonii.AAC.1